MYAWSAIQWESTFYLCTADHLSLLKRKLQDLAVSKISSRHGDLKLTLETQHYSGKHAGQLTINFFFINFKIKNEINSNLYMWNFVQISASVFPLGNLNLKPPGPTGRGVLGGFLPITPSESVLPN